MTSWASAVVAAQRLLDEQVRAAAASARPAVASRARHIAKSTSGSSAIDAKTLAGSWTDP